MSGDRTGFSKYSVSGSPIISQFRVYVREIVDLSNAIFVSIAKKLSYYSPEFVVSISFAVSHSMRISASSDFEIVCVFIAVSAEQDFRNTQCQAD